MHAPPSPVKRVRQAPRALAQNAAKRPVASAQLSAPRDEPRARQGFAERAQGVAPCPTVESSELPASAPGAIRRAPARHNHRGGAQSAASGSSDPRRIRPASAARRREGYARPPMRERDKLAYGAIPDALSSTSVHRARTSTCTGGFKRCLVKRVGRFGHGGAMMAMRRRCRWPV